MGGWPEQVQTGQPCLQPSAAATCGMPGQALEPMPTAEGCWQVQPHPHVPAGPGSIPLYSPSCPKGCWRQQPLCVYNSGPAAPAPSSAADGDLAPPVSGAHGWGGVVHTGIASHWSHCGHCQSCASLPGPPAVWIPFPAAPSPQPPVWHNEGLGAPCWWLGASGIPRRALIQPHLLGELSSGLSFIPGLPSAHLGLGFRETTAALTGARRMAPTGVGGHFEGMPNWNP